MKELIKNITNNDLDFIDMDDFKYINSLEYQDYYKRFSSFEHYRLLKYLSKNLDNETFLDIGTLKGCSSLALSYNKSNNVISFNVTNQLDLNYYPENIEYLIDNVLNEKYVDLIIQSKIILLDTNHDGIFEQQLFNRLEEVGFKGILILDDIYLNKQMKSFWQNIKKDKLDITHIGHVSGTGVVFF